MARTARRNLEALVGREVRVLSSDYLKTLTNGELMSKLTRSYREQCAAFLAQFDPAAKE